MVLYFNRHIYKPKSYYLNMENMNNKILVDKLKLLKDLKINNIDMQILLICRCGSYSVSELQSVIEIAYKNLLPHIKKLEEQKYIIVKNNGVGRKKEITTDESDKRVVKFLDGLAALFGWVD